MKNFGRIRIRLGKKASLSLSINAIVVLILAITMLGLGLAFMKGLFGKTTAQLGKISEDIEAKVIEDIQRSGLKMTFYDKRITIKRSESSEIYFGVKNQLNDPTTFKFGVDCFDALGVVGADKQTQIDRYVTFKAPEDTTKPLPIGDVYVNLISISADPNAQLTTYTCEIVASKGAAPTIGDQGVEVSPADDEYAREQFFVTVAS